jgi:hypothetical protein
VITRQAQRDAAQDAARPAPGVTGVINELQAQA